MEVGGKKKLFLYLTDWQRRMIKDFLGVNCHVWDVSLGSGPVVRYGVRPEFRRTKKMYLTDWQKREIMDETGESCNFVRLQKDVIRALYGIPPEVPPHK